MRARYLFFLTCCLTTATLQAQEEQQPIPVTLHIGDPAPPLQLTTWLKGKPVKKFKKGQVYVLEFWTTWCSPCRAAMPHLSALAAQYRGKATIISIDNSALENKTMQQVKAFVDSMGKRMDYLVATEDKQVMTQSWVLAAGAGSLPGTAVVDQQGRLAWIGHPIYLDTVLPKVIDKTWSIEQALAQMNANRLLDSLDREASFDLLRYTRDMKKPEAPPQYDSLLWAIGQLVQKEPRLKYMYSIAHKTFSSLLQTNPQMALEYGKGAFTAPVYGSPGYEAIADAVQMYADSLTLTPEIYQLGAEAEQMVIEQTRWPELLALDKRYSRIAELYMRAHNKPQAVLAMEKAIDALKNRPGYSRVDLEAFEARLRKYRLSTMGRTLSNGDSITLREEDQE